MMTMDEIREALTDRNLREVSRRSGVSYRTLWSMAREKTVPNYRTVKIVSDYLMRDCVRVPA